MPRIHSIHIDLIGPWERSNQYMAKIPWHIKSAILVSQRKFGERLVKIIRGHINKQDLNWMPLADSTVRKKGHERVYIDTYKYYSSITTWQKGGKRYIGIKPGTYNTRGIDLSLIAFINEYGSKDGRVPARPIWGPSIKEVGGTRGLKAMVTKDIFNKLARKPSSIELWRN